MTEAQLKWVRESALLSYVPFCDQCGAVALICDEACGKCGKRYPEYVQNNGNTEAPAEMDVDTLYARAEERIRLAKALHDFDAQTLGIDSRVV